MGGGDGGTPGLPTGEKQDQEINSVQVRFAKKWAANPQPIDAKCSLPLPGVPDPQSEDCYYYSVLLAVGGQPQGKN